MLETVRGDAAGQSRGPTLVESMEGKRQQLNDILGLVAGMPQPDYRRTGADAASTFYATGGPWERYLAACAIGGPAAAAEVEEDPMGIWQQAS